MFKTLKLSKDLKPNQFQLADTKSDHVNKVPFKCSLFEVDKISDGSPHGAGGKKIRISSAVCDEYLHTFVGMAFNIDYHNEMRDHDSRFKVGVIEKAHRTMEGFAMVEGYIYGKDFADVVATIRYYNGLADEYAWDDYRFGASLEMEAAVSTAADDENVLDITEFCGTGGAILFADDAAFKNTSFAARNQNKEVVSMTPEEIKAMQDSMKAMIDGMTAITASVQTVVTEVGAIKTDLESVKAAKEKEDETKAEEKASADLKAAQDKATALEKEVADLKAAAAKKPDEPKEPDRKTFSASQLLSKFGSVKDEDVTDLQTFSAAVDGMNLPSSESFRLKLLAKEQLSKKGSE